jgi:hypothetical protein
MLRSRKASFLSHYCSLAHSSHFIHKLHGTIPIVAMVMLCVPACPVGAQASATTSNSTTSGKICDGQVPAQKPAPQASSSRSGGSDNSQSGSETANDQLRLSTKVEPGDSQEPQGQFCKRSDRNSGQLATSPPASGQADPSAHPDAPPPIAQIKDGQLTVRANGQQFASVLEAVRATTGITIDMPAQNDTEPVFLDLGPTSTKNALMALLDGTKYNYVIVGSPTDSQVVTRLILSERNSGEAAAPLVASNSQGSQPQTPQLYGGQGFQVDAEAENAEPPAPPPPPASPRAIPSSVPTGINIQQMAAQENKTPAQILDELQKRQIQMMDEQAAAAAQSQQQP